jgi:ring-1,2-phenylacetyl-CoA epoxidase subunit PaaE
MIGDELQIIGASGFFILPEHPEKYSQIVFLAAGSGIVPVFALIKSLAYVHPSIEVVLIYSNTSRANTIFINKLEELRRARGESLQIEFLFSRAIDAFRSRLTPESIEEYMQRHHVSFKGDTLFYVCGPQAYMRMISYRLSTLGVAQSAIRKEIFHIQHPTIRPEPPDKVSHTVTLMRKDQPVTKFTVQYPVTILQAAKLLDIHIPYSCESGQCGSCVAKCLQGSVWMTQNEVLLDEEVKKGFILTCTGYPIQGDVILAL